MDLLVRPNKDEIINYNVGTITLKKDIEYIANYHWVKHLNCYKTDIRNDNYNINIDLNNKSLLISRSMGLGDILFLSPIIKKIKDIYPTCKLGFATVSIQHELLKYIPGIEEYLDYPIEYKKYQEYDYHFSVSGLIENEKVDKNSNIYLEYFKHVGIENPDPEEFRPILKVPSNIPEYHPDKYDLPIIGIHPFSGDNMRRLNLKNIILLCNMLIKEEYDVLLFSNKNEYTQYNKMFPTAVNWSIKSAEKPILNTIIDLKSCKTVLCSDSFITHLCQAIGINCISIYGPFSPECRISSYKNITIIDTNPDCRCFKHQLNKCPKGFTTSPCLNFDNDFIIKLINDQSVNLDELKINSVTINHYNMGK